MRFYFSPFAFNFALDELGFWFKINIFCVSSNFVSERSLFKFDYKRDWIFKEHKLNFHLLFFRIANANRIKKNG